MAAALITPSGAAPMPISAWVFVPEKAQEMAAPTSPSAISLTLAPASRISFN